MPGIGSITREHTSQSAVAEPDAAPLNAKVFAHGASSPCASLAPVARASASDSPDLAVILRQDRLATPNWANCGGRAAH